MVSSTGHAGDLSPADAMELLRTTPGAVLIDVRTPGEWQTVGVADLAGIGGKPVLLEWLLPPAMTPNPAFIETLRSELTARGAGADTPLLFLCRSGARSTSAARAMAADGFPNSYNVAGGFEGSPGQGLAGWRRSGLPWTVG